MAVVELLVGTEGTSALRLIGILWDSSLELLKSENAMDALWAMWSDCFKNDLELLVAVWSTVHSFTVIAKGGSCWDTIQM